MVTSYLRFAQVGAAFGAALTLLSNGALAQVGLDRPGENLLSFDLSTPDAGICKKSCEQGGPVPGCKAFVYVKPDVQKPNVARCWLKARVPAPVKNDCCVSGVMVPFGLVLAFRNLQNQSEFPDPNTVGIKSTKATGCDVNGKGWQWYVADNHGFIATDWRLPPGLVFDLDYNRQGCGTTIGWISGTGEVGPSLNYDKRRIGNYGSCKPLTDQMKVCHGGDIGASEHVGYYWLESTGAGFNEWPLVLERIPPYAIIGLKHSENQRDKVLNWNGVLYDPANLSQAPPPGLIRMHGGDQGASCDEGYYWYELNVGQAVWKPQCKGEARTAPAPAAVDLYGAFSALNEGTNPQPVTLNLSGTLESSQGSSGRTSFTNETAQGQLPRGLGQAPGVVGYVNFTVTNLQRGRWRVTVGSNVAGPVTCIVSLPALSTVFNATGSGNPCVTAN